MTAFTPLRILVVEDEPMIAMDIEATIEDEGHVAVGWARSASEAIRLYDDTSPDIVFLDVHLIDGTTGIQVAENLRARIRARYVFMTANASLIASDMVGGIGVLQKPFPQAQLIETLRYLHQGLLDPPPSMGKPTEFRLSPGYAESWV